MKTFVYDQIKDYVKEQTNQKLNQISEKEGYLNNILLRAPLLGKTYGVVDYRNGETTIQNPFQIPASILNNNLRGNNDLSKGIWIGRRKLKQLPINIDIGFLQVNHWCVMINGQNYSLETDNGSIDGKIQILQTQDKQYNWDYFGELNRDLQQVERFIQYINDNKIPYSLLDDNCQKMSLYIAFFANNSKWGDDYIGIENKKLNSTANVFDTFQQLENFKYITNPKIQQQQRQYKQFEQQGFQMYEQSNYQTIGQYNTKPMTLGQYEYPKFKSYSSQLKSNNYYQDYIPPLQNINRQNTPQFDLNQQKKQLVQPFQSNLEDRVLYRGTNNILSGNKKLKFDTSYDNIPDYKYGYNSYTQSKMITE